MRYACLMVCMLLFGTGFGQTLSGHWNGELPSIGKSPKCRIEMDITQTGNKLSGTAKYTAGDYWAVETFTGLVSTTVVTLNEEKVTSCNCVNGVRFCLKKMRGDLSIDKSQTFYVIEGTWTADTYYDGKNYVQAVCAPGKFLISRRDANPKIVKQQVVVPKPSVTDTIRRQVKLPAKSFDRPLDGYYAKTNILKAKVTPYASLREADVVFQKRIWQEIDLREKSNAYMSSPKARLIDILMEAITAGELTAYDPTPSKDDPDGDSFSKPLKPGEAKAKLADSSLVTRVDTAGNVIGSSRVAGEFNPDSIVRFRIKEDWMFDKQRSVMEPRIIGIAPLIKPKIAAGIDADLQPAFWIYFPEARQVLVTKEVVNRNNDATGLSYDDVFVKRLFTSYIVKGSNDKDERIRDYKQGIDRLYESERIKKALMDWELDLWQY